MKRLGFGIVGILVAVAPLQGAPRAGALRSAAIEADAVQQAPTDSVQRATAADPLLEARTRDLAAELRCPVCQGLSIQDSPTELAQEMKAVVRDQLAAGRTPDEVRAYFVDKYGEWILLEPKPTGINLAVYLLPLLALVGGGSVIAIAVRRWTRHGVGVEVGPDGDG